MSVITVGAALLREITSIAAGIGVAVAMWIFARPILLGLSPSYILFPRHEDFGQRLFIYGAFGAGTVVAAVLARWKVLASSVAGSVAYFAVIFEVQHLFENPDYWKLAERGYLTRGFEVLLTGAVAGLGVTILHRLRARRSFR